MRPLQAGRAGGEAEGLPDQMQIPHVIHFLSSCTSMFLATPWFNRGVLPRPPRAKGESGNHMRRQSKLGRGKAKVASQHVDPLSCLHLGQKPGLENVLLALAAYRKVRQDKRPPSRAFSLAGFACAVKSTIPRRPCERL